MRVGGPEKFVVQDKVDGAYNSGVSGWKPLLWVALAVLLLVGLRLALIEPVAQDDPPAPYSATRPPAPPVRDPAAPAAAAGPDGDSRPEQIPADLEKRRSEPPLAAGPYARRTRAVLRQLRESDDTRILQVAFRALLRPLPRRDAVRAGLEALSRRPDEVLEAVFAPLSETSTPGLDEILLEIAGTDRDPRVRRSAALAADAYSGR